MSSGVRSGVVALLALVLAVAAGAAAAAAGTAASGASTGAAMPAAAPPGALSVPLGALSAPSGAPSGRPSAQRESAPRIALVIGNARYAKGPLRNPVRDARAVRAALQDLGFEVELLEDADWNTMVQALGRHAQRAGRSTVRLVYYAGHGMQVHGRNYLNPIGPGPDSEFDMRARAVDADEFVNRLAALEEGVSLVIIDACRTNPWARIVRATRQGAPGGLAPRNAPRGVVLALSTGPGSRAGDDPAGLHSPYARHLLEALRIPGLPIEPLFKRVHGAVERDSARVQRPWLSSNLTGELCLRLHADGRCGSN